MASVTRYSTTIRYMHWLMTVLVIALLVMGWRMNQMESGPDLFQLIGLHKSLGLLALFLIIFRVISRFSSSAPSQENTVPGKLAHAGHMLLYVLMLTIPVSGLVMSWAGGRDTAFFGLFSIPGAAEKMPELAGTANSIHVNGIWVLGALIVLHIAAFAFHQFIQKQDILQRISLSK